MRERQFASRGGRKMAAGGSLDDLLNAKVDETAFTALVGTLEDHLYSGQQLNTSSTPQQSLNTLGPGHASANGPQLGVVRDDRKTGLPVPRSSLGGMGVRSVSAYSQAGVIQTSNFSPITQPIGHSSVGGVVNNAMKIVHTAGSHPQSIHQVYPSGLSNGSLSVANGKQSMAVVNKMVDGSQVPTTQTVIAVNRPGMTSSGNVQGVPANIMNSGVQIVNVNQVRNQSPALHSQKALAPRVVLSPQVLNRVAQPGQPLTLQALQGLQGSTSGHLLVKTENGQLKLIQLPMQGSTAASLPTTSAPASVASVFKSGSGYHRSDGVPVAGARHPLGPPQPPHPGPTYHHHQQHQHHQQQHLHHQHQQSLHHQQQQHQPQQQQMVGVSGPGSGYQSYMAQTPMSHLSPLAPHSQNRHLVFKPPTPTVVPAGARTASAAHGNAAVTAAGGVPTAAGHTPAAAAAAAAAQQNQRVAQTQNAMTPDTAKVKCKNFLATLLRLAKDQPDQVARNVRALIQNLIDARLEPETFTTKLQEELNSSPQPCLVPFLKKSLPYLRQSLYSREITIEGVKPPPLSALSTPVATVPVMHVARQASTVVAPPTVTPLQQGARLLTGGVAQPKNVSAHPAMLNIQPVRSYHASSKVVRTVAAVTSSSPASSISAAGNTLQSRSTLSASPVVASSAALSAAAAAAGPVRTMAGAVGGYASLASRKDKKLTFKPTFESGHDDDINDVAAMGGVNLQEESQHILGSTEFVGTQIRSVKDETFLPGGALHTRLRHITSRHGLEDPSSDVVALVSHAAERRLRDLLEQLSTVAEHRMDLVKSEARYQPTRDVRQQLRFLEELDKLERKRHEELERELLLRAAKSRSKTEDPEQAKLKAKAKEMQRVEMEEVRQREANLTALQAIGPRKKQRTDEDASSSSAATASSTSDAATFSGALTQRQLPLRTRVKRVNVRDLLFLLEQEREHQRSSRLYKLLLK